MGYGILRSVKPDIKLEKFLNLELIGYRIFTRSKINRM